MSEVEILFEILYELANEQALKTETDEKVGQ